MGKPERSEPSNFGYLEVTGEGRASRFKALCDRVYFKSTSLRSSDAPPFQIDSREPPLRWQLCVPSPGGGRVLRAPVPLVSGAQDCDLRFAGLMRLRSACRRGGHEAIQLEGPTVRSTT